MKDKPGADLEIYFQIQTLEHTCQRGKLQPLQSSETTKLPEMETKCHQNSHD